MIREEIEQTLEIVGLKETKKNGSNNASEMEI